MNKVKIGEVLISLCNVSGLVKGQEYIVVNYDEEYFFLEGSGSAGWYHRRVKDVDPSYRGILFERKCRREEKLMRILEKYE